MPWTSDQMELTAEEREELESVGKWMIEDIEDLIKTSNSRIQTKFGYKAGLGLAGSGEDPIRVPQIWLYFTFTDLSGSKEVDIERLIEHRLAELISERGMQKYDVEWSCKIA